MEGGNHPWNHRVREPSGILSFCYFLVLIWSGELDGGRGGGGLFRAQPRTSAPLANRHPGQRITSRVPTCPGSSLIYKKTKKKKKERKIERRRGGEKKEEEKAEE